MSRRHPEKKKRATRITIPENVSPHVRLVFTEMGRQRRTYDEVEELSGVLRTTLKAWRHKNKPGIDSIEAVLGSLGWDFVPIPRAKVLPKALVADLQNVAEAHGLTIEKTIEALVALVARVHERFPYRSPPARARDPEAPPPARRRRLPRGVTHPDQAAFLGFAEAAAKVLH